MRRTALLLIAIGIFVGCGVQRQGNSTLLGKGATPPKLTAEGWINGPAPLESDLAGKVVVVDIWAHW